MSGNNKLHIFIIYDYIFLEITNNFVHNIFFSSNNRLNNKKINIFEFHENTTNVLLMTHRP